MKFEIEMLNVGNADAMILRYFGPNPYGGEWEYVVTIDAGNRNDGKKVIQFIHDHCGQDYIDLAVCTHPDNDHIGGYFEIVDKIEIKEFWIHDPALHVSIDEVRRAISLASLQRKMTKITESINNNVNLIELLDRRRIPRREPFQGLRHPVIPIMVLGPSESFYEQLLKTFRSVDGLFKEEEILEYDSLSDLSLVESLSATLDQDDDRSSENNSSAILFFYPPGFKCLFTGDAGPMALDKVVVQYPSETHKVNFLDVPHHGSKKNLTSTLVTHFSPQFACVSGKGQGKYPSRAVVSALQKVGSIVGSTSRNGGNLLYFVNMPIKPGYGPANIY